MKKFVMALIISIFLMTAPNVQANSTSGDVSYLTLFDEICGLVEERFHDPVIVRGEFQTIKKETRQKIHDISTQHDFSEEVNHMLKRLGTSHTYYLSPRDYEYYHLAAVFSPLEAIKTLFHHRKVMYPSVGIITENLDGHVFIVSVLPGSKAEKAGLLSGDEIMGVNGKPYQTIDSLTDNVDKEVDFEIKRDVSGPGRTISVKPVMINPKKEMLEAEENSIRVIESQGKKIGYIHIYSYAGEEYHEAFLSAILWGPLRDADALIIDLRYGLGGADPAYLNVFNPDVPVITWKDNTGQTGRFDSQWRKPAVYLVNKASRSGKEILAFGARKFHLATVIGERTAGAVVGGSLFPLSNGDLLYLAVRSSEIDGVNLEGVGVAPDIEVPMDIRYSRGKDPQLMRAIDHLVKKLASPKKEKTGGPAGNG